MESLEYLTLKRYRTQLEAAVQANLVAITSELLSRGLISKKSSVWLRDKSKSLAVRASNLVAMVMNGVRLKPDNYNAFVEVLQKCGIHIIQPIKADKARVAVGQFKQEQLLFIGSSLYNINFIHGPVIIMISGCNRRAMAALQWCKSML